MSTKQTERRRFQMAPNLLMQVIERQAGTLAKAILEGAMNAVDAKAKACHITLNSERLSIEDDGIGIKKRQQIEKFFETFGQEHDADEAKVFGEFRMGRGQLFAYGANSWRTGGFAMEVDIKQHGLDYDLTGGLDEIEGCKITIRLYDELLPSDIAETERNVREWLKYCPIPVFWNGVLISKDPAQEKWDHVTPEAYVRLKANTAGRGEMLIYNLGVFTMALPGWRFGTGGVVVTRQLAAFIENIQREHATYTAARRGRGNRTRWRADSQPAELPREQSPAIDPSHYFGGRLLRDLDLSEGDDAAELG